MMRPKESLALRAGVVIGMAAGFCFACGISFLLHVLRFDALHKILGVQPLVFTLGIVPLFWFVWGVRLLKKVEAAD